MNAQRALVDISENIRQVAISMSGKKPNARMQERDGVFRFEGFSGSALVDLVGDSITLLEPRSTLVVYSSLIDLEDDGEKALLVAGRVCDEMISIYRQQVMV
ncbi:hypothetical protein IFT48_04300 [Pseudomonas fluorescens]|uniref:hypothetical protein n=1 Tax=Pseudomonas TaxID=286 RepID=UPI000F01E80E|nr:MULTISPECIES: hypothetical protein [Pseudomonas]MBD8089193.1 hypothetical protein [Pseudomonas fluorescens]MBD8615380.1 hypothetical protein [Pseudomonas putida]MBD8681966.1 hypothetical protein [Pseudomonas sp. CFBP 13719]